MKISQIMNRTVKSCRPDDRLSTAAGSMWDNDIGCLPVVDNDGAVVGVITDRDVCMAAYTQGSPLHVIAVASAMSHIVYSCLDSDSIISAEEVMRSHRVRRLPILDRDGLLTGILSLNDLAIEAERQQTKQARELSEREVAVTLAAVCAHRRPSSIVKSA